MSKQTWLLAVQLCDKSLPPADATTINLRQRRDNNTFFSTLQLTIKTSETRLLAVLLCPNSKRGKEFSLKAKRGNGGSTTYKIVLSARRKGIPNRLQYKTVKAIQDHFAATSTLQNRPRFGRSHKLSRAL